MDTQNIELIADILSNIFDWDSQDLKYDFIQSLLENEISISSVTAEKIFDEYMSLEATVRNSPEFDFHKFILNRYIS